MKSPTAFGLLALAFHLVSVPAAATCNPADPAYICGIEDAEDLVRLPGTPWVLASQLNLDVGFVIAQIDPATFTAKEVYRSGKYGTKGEFGSVTVALQVGKSLWAGTVHGDRVAVLPLKP